MRINKISEYEHVPNAAIWGWNKIHLPGAGIEGCKQACNGYEWCNSFDYYKSSQSCDLSDAPISTNLKTDWTGNPHDFYRKKAAEATTTSSKQN